MPPRDDAALRQYVEHMAMLLAQWGFPRMPARVMMLMMSVDETQLSAADIAERLEISPAAVSGSVRYLQQLGILVREPVAGSRRDLYRLPEDPWFAGSLAKDTIYVQISKLSREGAEAAGGRETPAGARIAEMADFFDFMQLELAGMLARWKATRAG